MLPKCKLSARVQLNFNFIIYCAAKTQTLEEISQILQSNSQQYGDVQVIF